MGTLTLDEYLKKKKEEEDNITSNDNSITSDKIMTYDEYFRRKASVDNVKTYDEYFGITNKTTTTSNVKSEIDTSGFFKKSEAFDDDKGNWFTDTVATVGGTVGDIGVGLGKGIFRLGEGIGDLISYGIADIQDAAGNSQKAEATRQRTKESLTDSIFKSAEDFVDKNSILGDKSDSITEGLGYVAGMTAVSIATGGAATALGAGATGASVAATIGSSATTFASAMGSGISDALNDGATMKEARIYGAISGAGEMLSELMFGGLGKASGAIGLSKGAGELDDMLIGGLTKNIKNKMVKTLVQGGLKASGEGLEEVVSGLVSSAAKKMTYMSEKKWSEIVKDENLAEQFWMGALTSAVAQGPSMIKSTVKGQDFITGRTNNEQKVYDNEVKTRTENKVRQATIEQAYNNEIKTKENLGIEITDEVKAETRQKVENAYDNGTLKSIELNKKEQGKIDEQVLKDMEEGNISIESIRNTLGENQDISKDNLLMRSVYENEQKYKSYQVEKTDNEKINNLMQSAADSGMNNTSKTRKKVELISKLVKDTDRQYKFVSSEQLKQMGYNENANGLINKETGEILINAHSDKGLQSIVGHETTHIFDSTDNKGTYTKEYQALQNAAIEYAKTKGIYDSKVQSITNAYGDLLTNESQIKEELTADLVGDFLFNDEKFIEHLATKDKNIFQKIYDYIKQAYVKLKGTEEEKAFLELKNKFEKVYKTLNTNGTNTETDTKYSMGGIKGLQNMKDSKKRLELYEQYKEAKRMAKEHKSNEEMWKKTHWIKDATTGELKFYFSDAGLDVISKNYVAGREYDLKDMIKHDVLFELYPQLKGYKVIIEDRNKNNNNNNTYRRGGYNSYNDKIRLDYRLFNDQKEVEKTLAHEIQHAVQKIENFSRGASTEWGIGFYKNNPGEKEARTTADRMLAEKYKGKDFSNMIPEYANDYISMLDKMKISLYNYLKEIENGGENNDIEKNVEQNNEENSRYDELKSVDRRLNNYFNNLKNGVNSNEIFEEIDNQGTRRNNILVDGRGRIEYSLTADRMLAEKYKGKDFSNKIPEYAKYNYLKDLRHGGEKNVFKNKESLAQDNGKNRTLVDEGGRIKYSITQESENNSGSFSMDNKVKYHISETFSNEIDNSLNGKISTNNQIKARDYTPKILVENGVSDLPMLLTQKHLRQIIYTQQEAENLGYKVNKKDHYHGLGKETLLKAIDNMDNPQEIYKQSDKNYLIITELKDNDNNTIIVPIQIDGTGTYNNIDIIENQIASVYGRENLEKYINDNNFEKIYEKNRSNDNNEGVKSHDTIDTSINSIAQTNEESNTIIDNSMQKNEKNTLENSKQGSFSLTNDAVITGDDIAVRDMLKQEKPTIEDEVRKTTVEDEVGKTTIVQENNTDKYKRYKQNILKARAEEINNLIKSKNDTIREIEHEITEKEKLLNSKKDKTTKVANELKMQIESLKQRKIRIENEYNSRIDRKNEKVTKDRIDIETKKQLKLTREEVKKKLLQEMGITEKDIAVGEDIKAFNFQITDPVRANEKVFGKDIGTKINNATINKTKHNTAEKIRWQNKEREEIKNLGIKARSKESAAVQKYGEKQYVDEYGEKHSYGDLELANEFSDVKVQEKIKHAANVIRSKYDTFLEQVNNVLTGLGYDPIPKREDYMRHFQELTDKFSQTGIPLNLNDMNADVLSTDINGLTAFNKPGKNWFASALQRTGEKTVYDAITGIDGYIETVGNLIYHTGDIQNYRALSSMIRETYGQEHGLDNIENMTEDEATQRIKDVQNNKLSRYVAWLDEQANSLAGKKGFIDRGFEAAFGRRVYNVLNTAKKQVGSNMTGFNVRSALTNFISTTIAASKTKKLALAKGTISTISNMFHNDGFIDKSDFLTSRFGSEQLSTKLWQKAANAGQILMSGSDYFTSNIIARSKYYEGLQKGMTEKEALNYSNDFSARVMGDRSQGATAEIFNSKTLGLLTQFQLETNNLWQFMVHDTKMDYQQNAKENNGMKAGATALFQMGQLAAYSYFFDELFEKVTGSRATFDPIEIIKTLFGLDDDDDDKDFDERMSEAGALLVDNIPFANLFTGGGRIPVSEAFTGVSTLFKKQTGGTDEYGNKITWEDVKNDTLSTLPYWVLPTGYSQIKKTVKGLSMYSNDVPGSYTDSGDLRYTVDEDVGSKVQAALFGAYANPYAQDYVDSGYKSIKKDNIDEMVGLDMNSTEYRQYKSGLSKASTTEDKLNYINSLDLTDAQKTLAANNLNKDAKSTIDMFEYGNYGSYDEYKYARDNSTKYNVISQITDYDTFNQYKSEIETIKEQYNTTQGKKAAVQSYIESLDLNMYQKMMLEKMAGGYSIKNYKKYIYEYLETTGLSESEKYDIWVELFD